MNKITLASVTIIVFALLINKPQIASACTPVYMTPQESFNSADAVFLGRVLSVATSSEGEKNIVTGNVQVDKYWKGNMGRMVKITSSGIFTCGPAFGASAKGGDYLIYATRDAQSPDTYHVRQTDIKLASTSVSEISTLGAGISSVPNPNIHSQFERNLMLGSTGSDVAELQTYLEQAGFLVIPPGIAKGYFGSLTKNAVAKYQMFKGIIPAAGYFGPITRKSFNEAN